MKDPPPYHVAYVVGNTLQVYSTQYSTVQYTVQYMWLEIHYKCTVQYQVVLSRKEAAELGKIFTSTNSTHTLIRRLGIEKKQQFSKSFQNL